ncbi:carbohydrate-binding protein [Haloferula sp.]|uniref:carbohydrate-binding protein n=1 Tax=Haloferula sp. TaxID=2497595 RepID=UPI0032A02B74
MKKSISIQTVVAAIAMLSTQLEAQYTYSGSGNWATAGNWSHGTNNGEVPGTNLDQQAVINGGSTVTLDSTQPNIRALRLSGGSGTAILNINSGAFLEFTTSTPWDSSIGRSGANGVVNQSGGDVAINFLELGRDNGTTGELHLSGGTLILPRAGDSATGDSSLIIGTADSNAAGGTATGLFEISGGSFQTRAGVWLGGTNGTANATFSVLGSRASEIGIGTDNDGNDGNLTLNDGAILSAGIDFGGVTKILIDDHGNGNNFVTFESGSLLDVDYYAGFVGGGTWTVLELENGDIDAGLGDANLTFAPGVDTNVWSFAIDNSGTNGVLTVTSSDPVLRDAYWDGSESTVWEDPLNWTNNFGAFDESYVHIDFGTVNYTASSETDINLRGFRMTAGTLNISDGLLRATDLASAYSQMDGTINQTGGTFEVNALELGRGTSSNAVYTLSDGELKINRAKDGYSLYLGANRNFSDSGSGTLTISGGQFSTRTGVKLGDDAQSGTGKFVVLGTGASEINIAGANDDSDGFWEQNSGSTLELGIDFGGVTPIFITDSATNAAGTYATFEAGSLLDVDYYNITEGGGTWVVMEVENGEIDAGEDDVNLSFAPGVDTNIWSFAVDNSGPNGRLLLTATGDPLGHELTIGNTPQQQMRFGMDYERLWSWTGGLNGSERDDIARWSAVDTDIDYVRVAINCEYELTEGVFDLSAYTDKIIPMMQEMQQANPNIKFFASPRPLDEAQDNVNWQPYPQWITGSTGNNTDYDLDWENCAEYLERYILLMDSYGFKISFLDLTNEWDTSGRGSGAMSSGDVRDITEYLEVNLDAELMPAIVAASSYSYSQGNSWLNSVNTTRRRNAIDVAASHNTGRDGKAETFAAKVASIWDNPGDTVPEIWNTEVHGWKSTSSENETTSFYYYLEAIRAGFGGINGWLAIGQAHQGHAYILNPSGTPIRNVKYHIFQKLSSTSNYGHALDILEEPDLLRAPLDSDDDDVPRNIAAFIKGNLMTVWVINENAGSVPLVISPTGYTIAGSSVRRSRWTDPSDEEGFETYEPVTSNTSFGSTIPGESVCCFEIVLNTEDFSNDRIEAEGFSHQWGVATQGTGDVDGVENVSNINDGDWTRYGSVALKQNSKVSFRVARPAGRPDSMIQVREGTAEGPILGSVSVPVTNNWQVYQTVETTLSNTAGIYNLYIEFVEDAVSPTGNYLANLNWFSVNEPVAVQVIGLAATASGEDQIDLVWDSAIGATSYDVKRSAFPGGPFTTISPSYVGTGFPDSGLTPATTYYYMVNGNFDGEVGPDSAVASATTEAQPIVPANLVIGSFSLGYDEFNNEQLTFTIDQTGLGQSYQIQSSPSMEANLWTDVGSVFEGTGGPLNLDVLFNYNDPANEKYFFRVEVTID